MSASTISEFILDQSHANVTAHSILFSPLVLMYLIFTFFHCVICSILFLHIYYSQSAAFGSYCEASGGKMILTFWREKSKKLSAGVRGGPCNPSYWEAGIEADGKSHCLSGISGHVLYMSAVETGYNAEALRSLS